MLISETQTFLDTLFTHGLCVGSKVEEGMPMIRSPKVGPRRTFSSHCSKCSIIHRYIVFRNDFNFLVFGRRIGCFTLDSKLHEDSVLMNSTSFQKKTHSFKSWKCLYDHCELLRVADMSIAYFFPSRSFGVP